MGLVAGGLIDAGSRELAARGHPEFDVRTPGAARRRAQPLRRQPAEVHRRPRDPAGPGRAGGRAADLGRGRRRRGRDPSGAARPRRRRAAVAGHLAGPGRAPDVDDRVAVITVGVLSRPLPTADASLAEIGLLMGGSARHGRARAAP